MKQISTFFRTVVYYTTLVAAGTITFSLATAQTASTIIAPSLTGKVVGGTKAESVLSAKSTSDGGFIMGGLATSKDGDVIGYRGGSSDIWIVKLYGNGALQWQKPLGGGNTEKGTIVHELKNTNGSSAGFLVGGTTCSSNGDIKGYKGGSSDIWIVRLDTRGNILWQRSLGGNSMDEITSMELTPDGGCIVAGNTTSPNGDVTNLHGGTDLWIVKLNASGMIEWQRAWGSTGEEKMQDLDVLPDGSVIAICRTSGGTAGGDITKFWSGPDLWIVRLSSKGELLWQRTLGGTGLENVWAIIRRTSDGNFIFGGGSDSGDGDVQGLDGKFGYWIVKLSDTEKGKILWQWAEPNGGNVYCVRETADQGFIVCGSVSDNGSASGEFVKLTKDGALVWKRIYGGSWTDEPHFIQELANGNYVSFGTTGSKEVPGYHTSSDTYTTPDVWMLLLDPNGNKLFERAYGGSGEDWIGAGGLNSSNVTNQMVLVSNYFENFVDQSGNIFYATNTNSLDGDVSGLHYSSRTGRQYDVWFMKFNYNTSTTLRQQEASPISLMPPFGHRVYPNPGRNTVTISFTAAQPAETVVDLYDMKGRKVQSANFGYTEKGATYNRQLNLSRLAAGSYLYQLRNGGIEGKGYIIKTD